MTTSRTAVMAVAREDVSHARDRGLGPLASALTGSAVEIDGHRADGRPYVMRTLTDISIVPCARGGANVIGMEPGVGIRSFRLDGIGRMRVLTSSSERVLSGGMVANGSSWIELGPEDLEALRGSLGVGGRS